MRSISFRRLKEASAIITAGWALSDSVGFYMPWITVPRSRIYQFYFARRSCPKCGEVLSAPAFSEFLKHNNVRHTWMCGKCDYEFETLVLLNIPPAVS